MITYKLDESSTVYIVLDGIGGSSSGEVASQVAGQKAVEYLRENYTFSDDIKQNIEQIAMAVKYANKCVYELNKTNKAYKDMGTTIALLLVDKDMAYVATVGDTRVYEVEENSINQLTEDDTYVNALVKDGIITKEEALVHPEKHVLLKALGVTKAITVDVKRIYNVQGHKFLLCSDGLNICVKEEAIFDIIKNNKPEDVCTALVNEANNNGGMDNITVMYIEV